MKKIKTYTKYIGYTLLAILLSLLFISTLYYFNILSSSFVAYLRPLTILLIIFISSYSLGKHSEKNGYLEGLKLGLLLLFIFFVVSLIFFRSSFQIRLILYDLIILMTSIFGSMVGISKEKKN